ncbi:PREDICTED: YTH domain-containing protein 1-like isoform X2 [Amphimedon queenslandica]|uniref:YTH domain-containing protein n=1 Tax=Amphimedon queenslandica TaxID=400682 RepID=A0AAN0ILE3_AMPQE|nr:PREDICTED: YTH domain-containing protein 1-like isoform X2 [Amphimedon queenslandica]|eukprot:XP_011402974.1 PREDICTED: YTH domain-containing protein 1-like isoform X2 [Amphimedon queenslandica]
MDGQRSLDKVSADSDGDLKNEADSSPQKVDDAYDVLTEEMEASLSPNGSVDKHGDDVDIMAGIDDIDSQHFEVLDAVEDGDPSPTEATATEQPKEAADEKVEFKSPSPDLSNKTSAKKGSENSGAISPIRFESKEATSSSKVDKSKDKKSEPLPHKITDRLFVNTRYFVIKSNNYENVDIAKSKNVWSTLPYNEKKLNKAYRDCRNVLLIFSVKESGGFQGFAKLVSESRSDVPRVHWVLPPSMSASQLSHVFKLDWIHKGTLAFNLCQDLKNPWNENKPVKIGRDGQEIEPSVGEKLCKLWLSLNADGSSSASSTVAPRDRRRLSGSHYHDVHVSQQPALFPTLSPYVSAPFAHPSLGLFAGGRPPHIHLNPTLYPPPSKHHLSQAEALLDARKKKSEHSHRRDRVARDRSRSRSKERDVSTNSRSKGKPDSSRRRRSRSRSRSRERNSRHEKEREKNKRGHTKESAFEKSFGVCKETLLHGSYADYIKEYAARSTRASGPTSSMGVNVAGIASQYQKALSHVATALASQTAAESQQPMDPATYNKKVEEFLQRMKGKSQSSASSHSN